MMKKQLTDRQKLRFDEIRAGKWDPPAALKHLGIRPDLWLKEVEAGRTLFKWPNDGTHDINEDRAFGGWIACLSDHVVSITMGTALDDDEWFTTTELQTRILRPVRHGLISIEGKLISRTRSIGLVEAEWRDEAGTLLVKVAAAKAIRKQK